MWLCLNNGFFSIVAPKEAKDDRLVVRARRKGDLERVFGVEGQASPGRDYAYRAHMERDTVAAVVMCCVLGIDYNNFKDSVKDHALHDAYMGVWSTMGRLQVGGPYGHGIGRRASRGQPSLFARSVQKALDPDVERIAKALPKGKPDASAWPFPRVKHGQELPTMTEDEAAGLLADGMPDVDPLEGLRYLNR